MTREDLLAAAAKSHYFLQQAYASIRPATEQSSFDISDMISLATIKTQILSAIGSLVYSGFIDLSQFEKEVENERV